MLLAGARRCRAHTGQPRQRRRVRRLWNGKLFLFQPVLESRPGRRHRDVPAASYRQRQGFPRHPGQPYLRSARSLDERADRLLDLARRGARGLPVAARRRMRRGAGRRRDHRAAAWPRLCLQAERDPLARRPLPRLRSPRRGHRLRQRRRRGAAAPARGCDPRPRPHLGGHQGHGGQQRRRRQGRLPGPQRGRPGRRHRAGACGGGDRRRRHRLCRMPRHRHRARRSDRGRGPDRRLRPHRRGSGRGPHRLGQDQYRPSRHRRRRRQPDQGGAGPDPWADAAEPRLRGAESGHRLRHDPVLGERGPDAVPGPRPPGPRRGQLARGRRHQCPCRGRGRAGARRLGRIRLAVPAAGAVGPQPGRARRQCPRPRRASAREPGAAARRCRLDAQGGAAAFRSPAGARRP